MEVIQAVSKNDIKNYFFNSSGELEINLLGEIGWEFNTESFFQVLTEYEKEKVRLNIYSFGGSAFDAMSIYDLVKGKGIQMDAYIYGMAASAATIFACAANKVYIGANASYLIHNAFNAVTGEETDLSKSISERIAQIYKAKTKQPIKDIRSAMEAETVYDANQAVAMGFADEVVKDVSIVAAVNKNFLIQNNKDMANDKPTLLQTLAAKFGLKGTTEEEVIQELNDGDFVNSADVEDIVNAAVEAKLEDIKNETSNEDILKNINENLALLAQKVSENAESISTLNDSVEVVGDIVNEKSKEDQEEKDEIREAIAAIKVRPASKGKRKMDSTKSVDIENNKNKEGEEEEEPVDVLGTADSILAGIKARKARK